MRMWPHKKFEPPPAFPILKWVTLGIDRPVSAVPSVPPLADWKSSCFAPEANRMMSVTDGAVPMLMLACATSPFRTEPFGTNVALFVIATRF